MNNRFMIFAAVVLVAILGLICIGAPPSPMPGYSAASDDETTR